jgi:hypothetical protein
MKEALEMSLETHMLGMFPVMGMFRSWGDFHGKFQPRGNLVSCKIDIQKMCHAPSGNVHPLIDGH